MSQTPGLAEFLSARLDEDEAAAKATHSLNWVVAARRGYESFVVREEGVLVDAIGTAGPGEPGSTIFVAQVSNMPTFRENAAHIARHDPARVLREVAAKRQILAEHQIGHDPCDAHDASLKAILCDTVLALAAVYSDHPDYRPEWAPDVG